MANLDCDQGAVLPKAHVLLALNLGRNPQVGGKILGNMNQVKKKDKTNKTKISSWIQRLLVVTQREVGWGERRVLQNGVGCPLYGAQW